MKIEALKTREVVSRVEEARTRYLKGALLTLSQEFGLSNREVAEKIGSKTKSKCYHSYIGKLLAGENPEDDDD